VSIEPFRQEIEPGIFLIGAPLGPNVFGFSKFVTQTTRKYRLTDAGTRNLAENILECPMISQIKPLLGG
jgi:hypothetical protein